MNEPNDPGAPVDELPAEASPAEEPSAQESPTDEPPIVRHDPFASMRGAPWMDRRLSPSGRAATLLRRELEAFPVIEGRDPNHADLDAIVKRTVDYIAPILKREQATDAAYDELERQRQERIAKARAASLVLPSAAPAWPGGVQAAVDAGKALAARVAAGLAIAPGAAIAGTAAGAAVALWPRSSDDGTFDLGEALRLRTPSGSLEGEIERRVGGRWEPLGIRATLNGGQGAPVLVDDAAGFARAVGADVAGRLADRGVVGGRPAPDTTGEALRSTVAWTAPADLATLDALGLDSTRLPVIEMRYLASEKGVTRFGDIAKDRVSELCPSYPLIQKIGLEAGDVVRQRGLVRARDFGQQVHRLAELTIENAKDLLRKEGIHEIHAELSLRNGEKIGFIQGGTRRLDVIEFRDGGRTICIYDFKTGRALFRDADMMSYGEEGAKHAYRKFGIEHPNVYVFPIFIPGLDGIVRQP
jgi:hypothetical protein